MQMLASAAGHILEGGENRSSGVRKKVEYTCLRRRLSKLLLLQRINIVWHLFIKLFL